MQIEITVPDGKSGPWEVSTFTITEDDVRILNIQAMLKPGCRIILPGTYKRLTRNGWVIMSNTSAEIRDHLGFIYRAQRVGGHILINGLGLGVALKAILESHKVVSVTIIDISEDVIKLVAPTYEVDPRVTVIRADAYTWKPPKGVRYACVWNDIWDYLCGDNLPEMAKLHRKYGKRTDWQDSWGKELCRRYAGK